jgi:hypothetical protein
VSISFRHRDVLYTFEGGDPVLVHATLDREPCSSRGTRHSVEPFIGEVEEMMTAGRYFYVRGRGERHCVPWNGFSLLEGFGRKVDE